MNLAEKKRAGHGTAPSRPSPSERSLTSALPVTPASSVLGVYAVGESSLPEDPDYSVGPVRRTSTASLRSVGASPSPSPTAAATTAAATNAHPSRTSGPAEHSGADTTVARSYWFARKGTWRTTTHKPTPVCDYVSTESSDILAEAVAESQDTTTGTLVLSPGRAASIASKKSHTRLPDEARSQVETAPQQPLAAELPSELSSNNASAQPAAPGSWWGWWYGQPSPAVPVEQPLAVETESCKAVEPAEEIMKAPMAAPEVPADEDEQKAVAPHQEDPTPKPEGGTPLVSTIASTQPRTWLGLWGGGNHAVPTTAAATGGERTAGDPPVGILAGHGKLAPTPVAEPVTAGQVTQQTGAPSAPSRAGYVYSYTWGLWSSAKAPDASTEDTVQLTIAGSDSKPNPPVNVEVAKQRAALSTPPKKISTPTPCREEIESGLSGEPMVSSTSEVAIAETSAACKNVQKMLPENHVLPAFDSCYNLPDEPQSILQRFTKILRPKQELPKDHLYIAKPRRVKRAVAIGVHGFFPMRLVRTVLGEPTGTSIRFASHAAASIKRWAEANDIEIEVEKVALEGEGKVADRVEMLWGLMQNWIDHIRNADFIMVAAHSQGVIVGIQLLAKLVEEGCVDNARIGFTAMAGINLGPFGHLPTTLLTGSARELFEFQKQDSRVSQAYTRALRTVLAHHIRILYVGSIDDQLVPLESSTVTNISHPYIYRAVFIDGRVGAPDFLSHLVGFAMKLRNLGVSDHGLIRELSTSLAGSLYGGQGHSSVYDEPSVYDLGVRHALETTDCTPDVPLKVSPFELPANSSNPYFLPWSLRGMLEETIVRTRLSSECAELLEQFENWKPASRTLRDVKFRLEGIRSKL